jgi:four helix bundle protein
VKEDNVIQKKSYEFAKEVVIVCNRFFDSKRERSLFRQLLRSGTSIGANVEEAIGAQSKKDFYAKLYIAYKEARETHYWLRLLIDTETAELNTFQLLLISASAKSCRRS